MSEVKHPKDQHGPTDVWVHRDTARIDLWYPRNNPVKYIHVGLMDVRAADGVRISYDFERDGWVIEQAQVFSWDGGDPECDPKWKEVAFIQAWASEVLQPWDDDYGAPAEVSDKRQDRDYHADAGDARINPENFKRSWDQAVREAAPLLDRWRLQTPAEAPDKRQDWKVADERPQLSREQIDDMNSGD